ncbi:MAG: hypothetical protein KZY61_00980 [Clostridiaceae bacterium]|nr:hypothetical protein [Clostridiaceae bacterium]MBW4860324.1 hypothetical protein [Clostridiaceae bacterium]MBW4867229.1 hypothetical protein [Clostridiaceae bacterium]
MTEKELIRLRWEALNIIGVKYQIIKNILYKMYNVEVEEKNFKEFVDVLPNKYQQINHQEILFELEDISYRKIAVFSMREDEIEELSCIQPQMFLTINKISNTVDNKRLIKVHENIYPCFTSFGDRVVTIKMAQIRKFSFDIFGENGERSTRSLEYYHCAKFIVDTQQKLVFLFYNDIHGDESNRKRTAITEKKQAFYKLFSKGNQQTLNIYRFDLYLMKYVRAYLESIGNVAAECLNVENSQINNSVILIETIDLMNSKNNLRSSERDGHHNKYRLDAIKCALEKENHTVKIVECMINNRWFQFKNSGEIVTDIPCFNREVIENVCKEIFPTYKLPAKKEYKKQATN